MVRASYLLSIGDRECLYETDLASEYIPTDCRNVSGEDLKATSLNGSWNIILTVTLVSLLLQHVVCCVK